MSRARELACYILCTLYSERIKMPRVAMCRGVEIIPNWIIAQVKNAVSPAAISSLCIHALLWRWKYSRCSVSRLWPGCCGELLCGIDCGRGGFGTGAVGGMVGTGIAISIKNEGWLLHSAGCRLAAAVVPERHDVYQESGSWRFLQQKRA